MVPEKCSGKVDDELFQNGCQAQHTHKTPGHAKHEAGERPTEFQSSIDLEKLHYTARFLLESAIIAPKGLTMLDGAVDRAAMGELQVQLTPQLVMR